MKKLIILIPILLSFMILQCGKKTEVKQVEVPPKPELCDDVIVGSIVKEQCPKGFEGEIIKFCTPTGWQVNDLCLEKEPECKDNLENKITFNEDVKPVIEANCINAGCHADGKYKEFDVARQKIDTFIYRVNLPVGNLNRMPKYPEPPLDENLKEVFRYIEAPDLEFVQDQTLDFFNELAPQMVKAKEIVSRWSVHHYHAPWLNVAVGYFVLL